MVKLNNVRIKGYKNILNADLSFSNFNVIIGPNNSGKSNFIQALSFLNYIINSSLDEIEDAFNSSFFKTSFKEIIPFRSIEEMPDSEEFRQGVISFELAFSNIITKREFNYLIVFEWSDSLFDSTIKIKNEKLTVKSFGKPGKASSIFTRDYESVAYGIEFAKSAQIKKLPDHFSVVRLLKIFPEVSEDYKDALDSFNKLLISPTFYFSHIELLKSEKDRINSINGRVVSFELEKNIIELENSNKWEIFNDAIRNILGISSVLIYRFKSSADEKLPDSKHLYFDHNRILKSINQFSDGTVLIIALITKVLTSNNPLILIEEPENSIHPKALIDLMNFVRSYSEKVQFIISSHSIPLLNNTTLDEIIASSISERGQCEFYNVSSKKELKNKLKKSCVNFSDELFFSLDEEDEFE